MTTKQIIIDRTNAALAAIKSTFGTDDGEYGPNLFISHHLEEIDNKYWEIHLGTTKPDPRQILDALVLRSHWGDEDEDGIDTFDFTLPEKVTDYVLSVRFDETGKVEDISMES